MCKAIDKNSVCCLPTYPRKLAFWVLLSEFWTDSFRFSLPGLKVVESGNGARLVTFSAGTSYCFG